MKPIRETAKQETGPIIGGLRIAKVTYEHKPIHSGGSYSIGNIIDMHLAEVIQKGEMISEVSLTFETAEQQHALANIYRDIGHSESAVAY